MKPAIALTSPQHPSKPAAVAEVWQAGTLQQPTRTPWGRIILLLIIFSFVIGVGVVVGAVWMQRYGPVGWWSKWLPIVTTTTVIQQSAARATSDAPTAVQDIAASLAGIAVTKTAGEPYARADVLGVILPLSDNGWNVTLRRPPGADEPSQVVIRSDGAIQPITTWIIDPSSLFVFAKAGPTNDAPAGLAEATKSLQQSVWVVVYNLRETQIVPRRLVGSRIPDWPSSDLLERTYVLDAPVANVGGAVVVNQTGQVIGLLADDGQVWPVGSLQKILKDLIQSGQLERTALGVRARRRDELIIPNDPGAAGWLIGAGAGQTAVTERGAADRGGLKSGDIILALDGQSVRDDIFDSLQRWQPGQTVTVTISRGGTERELTVQLTALRP